MKVDAPNYPDHLVDPKKKGFDWILQYAQAAWKDFNKSTFGSFYDKRRRYDEIMDYAQGQQSINGYKPLVGVDEKDDSTWININWDVLPVFPKFRRLAMSRLKKIDYNPVATAVDSLAVGETEELFKRKRAELKIREGLEKMSPGFSEITPVAAKDGDPKDYDELKLQEGFTYKHQMSTEIETFIKLVLAQNGYKYMRNRVKQNLFDWGIGGYKEYIDSNGAIKIREVDPSKIIVSRCSRSDFTDLQYVGELLSMSVSDLKQWAGDQFTDEEYKVIASGSGNRSTGFRPPSNLNEGYDDSTVQILDLEFFSVNEFVHQSGRDKRGNKRVSRTNYSKKQGKNSKYEYKRTAYKVLYKTCWIVGTDKMFNYGLCTDMKRAKSSLMDTTSSYHLAAVDFYNMRVTGITEQCIPVIDQLQISWYKMQQTIAEARPKGVMIEIGALEDVALGKGGQPLSAASILDLYYQKGVLVYRKADPAGNVTNYRPIEELQGGVGDQVVRWSESIEYLINKLRDITGLNEYTDGSTPDSRTLTTVAQMANEGTNNSLYSVVDAERSLFERLCNSVALRILTLAKKGFSPGYKQALGKATMDFLRINPDVTLHEYGITIEDKMTDTDKARLYQIAEGMAGQGLIDFEDLVIIESIESFKMAQILLAHQIKVRKKEMEEKSLRLQQANANAQQQSAVITEEQRRKTLSLEYELKERLLLLESKFGLQSAEIAAESRIRVADIAADARIGEKVITSESKEYIEEGRRTEKE